MKRSKYNFTKKMKCQRCGKEIELKGNRKFCADCFIENRKEYKKEYAIKNPRTKESRRREYLRNRDKRLETARKYRQKLGEELNFKNRLIQEQERFGGNRIKALERDNYICQLCGSKDKILVHHRDETGRGSVNHNNNLDNLITLCRSCHIEIHRKELYK